MGLWEFLNKEITFGEKKPVKKQCEAGQPMPQSKPRAPSVLQHNRSASEYSGSITSFSWFQRHLNWTLVIIWLLLWPVGFAIGFFMAATGIYPEVFGDADLAAIEYLFNLVVLVISGGWILRQKNRSLWWVIVLLIPFGWIVFLALDNRTEWRVIARSSMEPQYSNPVTKETHEYKVRMGTNEMVPVSPNKQQAYITDKPNYCSNCGSKLTPDSKYCRECGDKITRDSVQ